MKDVDKFYIDYIHINMLYRNFFKFFTSLIILIFIMDLVFTAAPILINNLNRYPEIIFISTNNFICIDSLCIYV